jgi:hypothetical protein
MCILPLPKGKIAGGEGTEELQETILSEAPDRHQLSALKTAEFLPNPGHSAFNLARGHQKVRIAQK